MEWYDYNEDDEEEENSEDESEEESMSVTDQDGEEEDEEEGDSKEESEDGEDQGENEEDDKNYLMDFVLQLESVADKDDNTEIERKRKKQLNRFTVMKGAQIDSKETDSEDDDSLDTVIKK